ncbi:MAG: hypothetical protein MR727_02180 [Lentisphaeria bacterium]|nr:hypothetical protein [Lentisphaeria bacterium]
MYGKAIVFTSCRLLAVASFVLILQFFDKFFRNVLDNLSQHHHIMLLRSHVSILWLVAEKAVALCIPENAPPRESAKESLFISILFPVLHAVFHSVLCSVLQTLLQSVFYDFCSGSGFSRIESCGTESDCDDPDCCHGHDSFHVLPPFFSIFVLSELLLSAPSLRMRFFRRIYSFPEKNAFFFKKASLTAKNQSKTG